jgi:ABC-type dipeptide/oligopeptide/nickel transport system permease subunit
LSAQIVRVGLRSAASLLAVSALAFLVAFMPSDPVIIVVRAWNLPVDEGTMNALRARGASAASLWSGCRTS